MATTISVAIATYNGAAYLGEQLASIAAQGRPPDELVISDDGSTDETRAIVRRFAAGAAFPVRLIEQSRRLGILDNFYAAFAGCGGDVLVYCDQDDVWAPDKLARQLAEIERGAALVAHPSLVVDEALRPLGGAEPSYARPGHYRVPADWRGVAAYGHQMMFTRPVLERMVALRDLAERQSSIDFTKNLDVYIPFCASLAGSIVILPDALVRFRRHSAATSGAGLESKAAPRRAARIAARLLHAEATSGEALAVAQAAEALGLVASDLAATLLPALARRAALARRQADLLRARGAARIAAAPPALVASLRSTGFANQPRWRALALTIAAGLFGSRG